MGNKLLEVGPLELEVIGLLNAARSQSVSQIQASLKAAGHELAYTTVMTVLVRLHQKGLVTREKNGRQFLYSAASKKDSSPLNIFEKVKKSLFGSEKLKPILSLLEADDGLSRDELEVLKVAVEAKLKKRGRA
jgi:BlaI family transcriptional regulator, penicillinase repressor